ncbi:MAG: cysteine desulfurase [Anaerolineales bacterium]|nr:cysteine desulfurase [Anaerolineales bacterium]
MPEPENAVQIDVKKIIQDFPVLDQEVHPGKKLIYLDSAATSQKPVQVTGAMTDYYHRANANIHRGIHALAETATDMYEGAREKVAFLINAATPSEIIYTRNTTESINLVASSWGRAGLKPGDLVILTEMEHHSNLVPWQMLAETIGIRLEFIPVSQDGLLDLQAYQLLLEEDPKLVAFMHMSNVLGTINPAQKIIQLAHQAGALTLVDGAQAVPHFPVDVQDLDADFYAFSSHKMLGPTGIGILYGKKHLLEAMPPYMGGGDMIKRVKLRSFAPNDLPHKFEAGTPAIAEAVGLGAAVDYLSAVGMHNVAAYEHHLTKYALDRLAEVPGVWVFGPEANQKGGVASFTFEGVHPHDVSQILDAEGIAVRAGHHCAMPLHEKFKINATSRASFYIYNTTAEIDRLIDGLYSVKKIFG